MITTISQVNICHHTELKFSFLVTKTFNIHPPISLFNMQDSIINYNHILYIAFLRLSYFITGNLQLS